MSYVVYGGTSCSSCETAKNLLTSKGLSYSYINVDEDMDALEEVISNKFRNLPMIKFNGELLGNLQDLRDKLMS